MDFIYQVVVNGVIAGSFYALGALGFSLIVRTNRFIHLAHAAIIMIGVYILYTLFQLVGLNFCLASVLTIICAGGVGFLLFRCLYKPLQDRKASPGTLLLISIAIVFLVENIMLIIFGSAYKELDYSPIVQGWELANIVITPIELSVVGGALVMFGIVYALIQKTNLGITFRATSNNPELVKIRGIDVKRIYSYAFIIGSALAGYVSIFIALDQTFAPMLAQNLMIKIFAASLIGGLNFLPGAVLGGYFLGVTENLVMFFLPTGFKELYVYLLLFILLVFRPGGILNYKKIL